MAVSKDPVERATCAEQQQNAKNHYENAHHVPDADEGLIYLKLQVFRLRLVHHLPPDGILPKVEGTRHCKLVVISGLNGPMPC